MTSRNWCPDSRKWESRKMLWSIAVIRDWPPAFWVSEQIRVDDDKVQRLIMAECLT